MNNKTAFALALIITLLLVVDLAVFGGRHTLSLGREWLALLSWLAVWR